jgi:tRNA(Arg) A34 adenosine deaminase TadA
MCFSCAVWANIDRIVYANKASDIHEFTYEFEGISLKDLAQKVSRKTPKVEFIPINSSMVEN